MSSRHDPRRASANAQSWPTAPTPTTPTFPSVGAWLDIRAIGNGQPCCDAGAEPGVDVAPVLDDALLGRVRDAVAGMGDDVRDEVFAVAVVHHVAVEGAGLDEVVVAGVRLVLVASRL